MLAAILYLSVAGGIVLLLRRIERVPPAIAVALVLLPLFVTGRALLTGRIYAPLDIAYANEPLASISDRSGVTHTADPTASDIPTEFVPWHAAVRYSIAHGQWPLWNPFELCGGPLAGALQSAPYHPVHLLALLLPLGSALTFIATMLFFIAATSAFLFVRDFVRFDYAALFGATAWMFSRHLVAFAGTAHGLGLAAMPLVLFAARRVVRAPNVRTAALLCGSLILLVFSGHPETMLHVVALGAVYFAFELWRMRGARWRRAVVAGIAAGVGALLLSAIALVPFFDALPQTEELRSRSAGVIPPPLTTSRALHLIGAELMPLIEGLAGVEVPSHPTPIAHSWFGSAYCGTLLFALAAFALVRARRRGAHFFGALFVFGLLAGAGVLGALLSHVPIFSMAVNERMIWSAGFALCVLAALAVDECGAGNPAGAPRFFAAAAVVLAAVTLAVYGRLIAAGLSPLFVRIAAARTLVPLLLAAAATATIRRPRVAAALLFVLLIAQRSAETALIRPTLPQEALTPAFPGLELMTSNEPFRVVGQGALLTPNIATQYGLHDVRGYQAITLARYYDTFKTWSVPQPVWSNRVDDLSSPMLSLMNVRFALTPPRATLPDGWRSRASFPAYQVAENTRALPRAFVPHLVHLGVSGNESMKALARARDFANEGWIEGRARETVENGPGLVHVEQRGTDLVLHASMFGGGWVIATEAGWRGWHALENEFELRVRHADAAFIAFYLPQGEHRIELVYRPRSFVAGAWISAATLALIACAFAARIRFARASRRATILVPPLEPARA